VKKGNNLEDPLVSVCLITYNHELYIRKAIESVLMQKVNFSWEIIIADDCSIDATQSIINEYYSKYPLLIKPILRDKNVGAGLNFLELIHSAKAKYIAYLEGDDYWTDVNKLQKQFDFMESNSDFSMCYHKVNWQFMYESSVFNDYPIESNIGDETFLTAKEVLEKGWLIRSCSMFFRKIILPKGFEFLHVGDYPLHILLADRGKIGFINDCMGTYRIHQNGISETNLLVYDVTRRMKNHKADLKLLNYLNKQTNFQYDDCFKRKIFEEYYSFNHFLFQKNKLIFIMNLIGTLFTNNPILFIRQFQFKIAKKIK
jgi:glycosyltransferase involved in cell wall biosynthesis